MQAILSHYRILEQIGQGGMGVVYRAHDEHLDCDVALKVLPAGDLAGDSTRKRFRKEALALSKVNHPNIAVVHDFDTQDGTDFLVEELIPGLSLNEMLLSGPLPEREIIGLGSQLAEGLAAAHDHGVIHRDLKPGNIRVTPDARLKILDFGLAKLLPGRDPRPGVSDQPTASLTETQTVSGTFPYMAPEQLLNEKLDSRSDIWAVGCVLYEMATGQRPFVGYGPALINAILHHPPTAPSKLSHKIDPGLEAIILKCLEKDPALRYASARDIAVDLHRLGAGSVTKALAARRRSVALKGTVGVVVIAVIASAAAWFIHQRSAPAVTQIRSIAVLPLENLSGDAAQDYLADGVQEALITDLGKLSGMQRVIARTSMMRYRKTEKPLAQIARELGVDALITGSVLRSGDQVQVTVHLIQAINEQQLWADRYKRQLRDVLSLQNEIVSAITRAIRLQLSPQEQVGLGAHHPVNPEAYDAYLQGRFFLERRSEQKALDYFEKAIRLDPKYAPAWAGIARTDIYEANHGIVLLEEGYRNAREASEQALALDPNLAEAHVAMGEIKRFHEWDWAGADASFQRALALEPSNPTVINGAGGLAFTLGRFEEAMNLYRRSVELDPLNPRSRIYLGFIAFYAGRLEEAAAAFQKTLELNSEYPNAHKLLCLVYLAQSRPQEALVEAERESASGFRRQALALAYNALGRKKESDRVLAAEIVREQESAALQIAEIYAQRGEGDRAFEWLERAYAKHDPGLAELKGDPLLKNLERDPRYTAFLKKMRLPLD